ncbi:MAG: S-adenosylmethionine:tRNA ribosyltransferase-isomerase [Alphaproteobacteria bacterium]|nr:S-adenosylmethionine:tRNA ribosyltransferase-isomerase [Alphaproteobacteria bacterium]
MLHTSDFDFDLPPELIASHPLERRDASRMLVVQSSSLKLSLSDKHVRDFLDYLQPGDVVVFNNSRVIPARFDADGHEITLHTAVDDKNWWGLCKKFNKINIGDTLTMTDGTTITVMDKDDESGILLRFNCDNVFEVLNRIGKMPLPPYMKREAEIADQTRYQTVYADPLGSMAAPTAGLHFTDELMAEIEARGAKIVKITLHVGAGTWMPVKTENLSEHKMHSEWCQITPEQADIINAAKRVIAVGTTSLRTLESAAISSPPLEGCPQGGVVRDTVNYRTLPFNSKLKQRARELRHAHSLPEALLWNEIKNKKLNGLDFDRQKIIGNYIVDFFCASKFLVIEIDDKTHDFKIEYDKARDEYLKSLHLNVIHVSAAEVLKNPHGIFLWLSNHPGTSCHPSNGGELARVVPFCGTTDIFITPGYKFRVVDVLLTNFHLPKSTLFMLVSAFSGLAEMKTAYAHAVAEKYRFFSYGDCCLLFRKENENEI